jgi:hypothetical protein
LNEFLVVYLDSIDERLLECLDEDEELRLDTVKRLRFYTSTLLDGSITPGALNEAGPDWYHLAPAFVAVYAPEEVGELEEEAALLEGPRSATTHRSPWPSEPIWWRWSRCSTCTPRCGPPRSS